MTTRSQKRKAAEELISTEIETPLPENTPSVNPVAGTSKSPKVSADNLEEIKSSLRKEIMSDLNKILAENQKEMLRLIAPTAKKQPAIRTAEESDSDPENIPENATSTPIRNKTTATASKTTPINSRNKTQFPLSFFSSCNSQSTWLLIFEKLMSMGPSSFTKLLEKISHKVFNCQVACKE